MSYDELNVPMFFFVGNSSCFDCYSKGIHLKLASQYVSFNHRTDTVTFHPYESNRNGSAFALYLAYDLFGGQITGISSSVKMRSKIQLLSKMMQTAVKKITKHLETHKDFTKILKATEKLQNNIMEEMTILMNELSSDGSDFKAVYLHLANLKRYCLSFHDLIRAGTDQAKISILNQTVAGPLRAEVAIIKRTLKWIWELQALPSSIPISDDFSGLHASFFGKLCFRAFCFDNVDIELRDLKVMKSDEENCARCKLREAANETSVIITGKFRQNKMLAGYVEIQRGSSLFAVVQRNRNMYQIYLPVRVKIFDKTYETNLTINSTMFLSDEIHAEVASNILFKVQLVAENNRLTKWEDLSFRIIGYSRSPSKLTGRIDSKAAKYIEYTASTTDRRFAKINERIRTSQAFAYNLSIIARTKYQLFLSSQLRHRDAKVDYIRALVNHNRTRKRFEAQRVSDYFKGLEKELNKTCKFDKCQIICVPVPVCSVCQHKVSTDVNTMKCEQIAKQQKVTVTEPFETKCQITIYYVEDIYTGNCHAPGRTIRVDPLQNTAEYAMYGATIGSYFGGPIGGIIGGIIGGVVGLVTSMFGGCDDTREAILRYKNFQVPCQKARTYVATKHWTEASCYPTVVSVQSSYSLPKRCNCSGHCTNVQSPECVLRNSECRIKRQYKVREELEKANASAKIFDDLRQAEVKVQSTYLVMQRASAALQGARQEYETALASKKRALQEEFLANKSLENMNNKMSFDKCVIDIKGQRSVNTSVVSFESSLLSGDRLLFNVIIQVETKLSKHFNKETKYSDFVFVVDDIDVSLTNGAKTVVRNAFCAFKPRRRRSVEESINSTVVNIMSVSSRNNLTIAQNICIESETWFSFLHDAIKKLYNISSEVELERNLVSESSRTLKEMTRHQHQQTSNDSVVNEQSKLFSVLKKVFLRLISLTRTT